MKYFISIILFLFTVPCFSQTSYKGVVKKTALQSIKAINAKWDKADHTGNNAIDRTLDKFAAASKGNTAAIKALEGTAAEIKTDPKKYINPDGSVNKDSLQDLLNKRFKTAGVVTIPSVGTDDEASTKN